MKIQRPTRSVVLLSSVLIFVPFVYNSCQNGLGSIIGIDGKFAAAQCVRGKVEEINELVKYKDAKKLGKVLNKNQLNSVFEGRKLILDSGESSTYQEAGAVFLEEGTQLVALLNNACAESSTPDSWAFKIKSDRPALVGLTEQPYSFKLDRRFSVDQLNEEMMTDSCVIGVSFNNVYKVASSQEVFSDPLTYYQGHLDSIKADRGAERFYDEVYGVQKAVTDAEAVKIAVVDTGLSWTHSDIEDNVWHPAGNPNYWGFDARTATYPTANGQYLINYNPTDVSSQGHGTHVAGLVAAKTNNAYGVAGAMAQGAKIMAVKVFWKENDELVTTTEAIVTGMYWAVENGADVMNLSLMRVADGNKGQSTEDALYENAIVYAVNKGTVVVVAAGNSSDAYPTQEITENGFSVIPAKYGARYPGVITVGSYDFNTGDPSEFSHWSRTMVEIGAPGASAGVGGLYSLQPRSNGDQYGYLAGTSQAAPLVAAGAGLAIGLLRRHGIEASPGEIETLLLSSAEKSSRLSQHFKDGNALDLEGLAEQINLMYPKTANPENVIHLASEISLCP